MNELKDYVKVTSPISKLLCKDLLTDLETSNWNEHLFVNYSGNIDTEIQEHACQTSYDGLKHGEQLMSVLFNAIHNHLKTMNSPYFLKWNGYTSVKYNKYEKGALMEKHVDHIHSIFDGTVKGIPILSIIGLLNDDFEGGEIEMFEDTKIKLKAGEVLIFPSNFLYPHKVCPVTKGTRHSFVSWVY